MDATKRVICDLTATTQSGVAVWLQITSFVTSTLHKFGYDHSLDMSQAVVQPSCDVTPGRLALWSQVDVITRLTRHPIFS